MTTGSFQEVLIETLWNVKQIEEKTDVPKRSGINRNIVECKAGHFAYTGFPDYGINRNIVECKDSFFDYPLVPLLTY